METKSERRAEGSKSTPSTEDPRFLPLEVRAPTSDARCVESSLSSLQGEVTPTNRFFIRSHFAVPQIDPATWRLEVAGSVERPSSFTLAELKAMEHRELVSVLECAGNSRVTVRPKAEGVLWGHGAVSNARWRGVPLRRILDAAGVRSSAREVLFRGADHGREPGIEDELSYEMSIDLVKALDPDTLLVDEMNGEPLSPSHGFPLRVVVPGWYGMASVKWLTRLTLLDERFQGHFRTRAYAYIREGEPLDRPKTPVTVVRVKSLIIWPKEGQVVATGHHRIRGIAWSGESPILRVDVSTAPATPAGEVWSPAHLTRTPSRYSWTPWEFVCDLPEPGFRVLRSRATDELGNSQPVQAEWNFRGVGTNSIHCVPVEVRRGGPPDTV